MIGDACKGRFYFFGSSNYSEVDPDVGEVGSKAFNLMKMDRIALPVPVGFVICTHYCREYLTNGNIIPEGLVDEIKSFITRIENSTGLGFERTRKPLLSVRSGAAVSMPGMLETILNVGLCESAINALVRMTGNPRFVWDSYRRLVQTYGEVVHGCPENYFEIILNGFLDSEKIPDVRELDISSLKTLTAMYLKSFKKYTGSDFPQQPLLQLIGAVGAIFKSWESAKATEYRRLHNLGALIGTAVIIQVMVFGNMGATSGSGVGFTRDPSTGEDRLYMDFLFNAQGEDIVSGRRTLRNSERLREIMPHTFRKIQQIKSLLEMQFKDMQDFEFTVQEGKLFILQSRTGKRTPWAAIQIAVDLVNEGLIDQATAFKRIEDYDLDNIERMRLSTTIDLVPLCRGVPASHGVVTGQIALDSETATRKIEGDGPFILVRETTSTDDIAGMAVCAGVLANKGGRTSHAAVVARQMNKVCIVGCRAMTINLNERSCTIDKTVLHEGHCITLDGNTGAVYDGKVDVVIEKPTNIIKVIEGWKKL